MAATQTNPNAPHNALTRATVFFATVFFSLALFALPRIGEAAMLQFSPVRGSVKINQDITVDVTINSEEQTINGVQATIVFPDDKLQVTSLKKDTSTFNFWLE
ncbi:MAG: hypothetical protein AAB967_02630, partial [Patescibacteria group bacterium]